MPSSTAVAVPGNAKKPGSRECRVYQRFSCNLPTACQPPSFAGRQEMKWEGQIVDLSVAGLGVILRRRFEPGAGLTIELPSEDGVPTSILARVVHATAIADGRWRLGCAFVSQLGPDELEMLRSLGQDDTSPAPKPAAAPEAAPLPAAPPAALPVAPPAPPAKPPGPAPRVHAATSALYVTNVHLDLTLPDGSAVQFPLRHIRLGRTWPWAAGQVLTLRLQAFADGGPVQVRVAECRQEEGRWVLTASVVEKAPAW